VDANAHAIPNIGLSLPVEYKNGQKIDAKKCFQYKLDISWEISIGYCPFCVSAGDTENLFDGQTPSGCQLPAADAPLAPAAGPPPSANPSIANDGAGHTLAVWRAAYFEAPMQKLLAFARTPRFADRAKALNGYDVSGLGTVRYNAP
jgi:hypothetical protein